MSSSDPGFYKALYIFESSKCTDRIINLPEGDHSLQAEGDDEVNVVGLAYGEI